MTEPFAALVSAFLAGERILADARAAERERRRNDPVIKAARSAAARKGWQTRHAREAVEHAATARKDEQWAYEQQQRGPGPWCDEMGVHPVAGEVFCILAPATPATSTTRTPPESPGRTDR